jgi:type II secretory pathway component PulF
MKKVIKKETKSEKIKKEMRVKKLSTEKMSISNNDKLMLISNLSTLLSAGIPILESVESLEEEAKGNVKKLLEVVKADLVQGRNLSKSFAKFPQIFNKININILKASEESGTLETALKDLKIGIRRDIEFADKIKSALLYPAILLIVFFGVLLVILFVAIPKIATVFKNLRVTLPLPTKILIFISRALTTHTVPILIGFLVLLLIVFYLYKTQRKLFLVVISHVPFLSGLIREIDLTRFSRSLALLLNSGVPITTALELTQDVVVSKDIGKAISHSKNLVLSGGKLSEGFKKNKKVIPGVMIKIIEAGEKSGTLDKAMQDISDYMDYNVSTNLKTVTALLEPVILVLVGVFIGGMMLSIIAPIYNLIGQIGTR